MPLCPVGFFLSYTSVSKLCRWGRFAYHARSASACALVASFKRIANLILAWTGVRAKHADLTPSKPVGEIRKSILVSFEGPPDATVRGISRLQPAPTGLVQVLTALTLFCPSFTYFPFLLSPPADPPQLVRYSSGLTARSAALRIQALTTARVYVNPLEPGLNIAKVVVNKVP